MGIVFLRPRRADQQLSALMVQTLELLDDLALGVLGLFPRAVISS
jgi:hypothetical protein